MKEERGNNMDDVLNIEKCKICGGLVSIENSSDGTTKICTCCGYFYNKENPKLMVEKRLGIGWSINMAQPMGKLITIILVLITFGSLLICFI